MSDWEKRQAETKRKNLEKKKAIDGASKTLEDLWKQCLKEGNIFSASEAQAISEACQKIRSVQGGWANRRSRR